MFQMDFAVKRKRKHRKRMLEIKVDKLDMYRSVLILPIILIYRTESARRYISTFSFHAEELHSKCIIKISEINLSAAYIEFVISLLAGVSY